MKRSHHERRAHWARVANVVGLLILGALTLLVFAEAIHRLALAVSR